jgi:transposase
VGSTRRKYTPEYKAEAVELVVNSGRPIAEIARDLGINEGTLGNWVKMAKKRGDVKEKPLDINERARLKELEEEVRRLKMERELLKKAAAWFAAFTTSPERLTAPSEPTSPTSVTRHLKHPLDNVEDHPGTGISPGTSSATITAAQSKPVGCQNSRPLR